MVCSADEIILINKMMASGWRPSSKVQEMHAGYNEYW
jgi:hypothetical protein